MSGRRLLVIAALVAAAVAWWYFTSGRGAEVCTVCVAQQGRTRCETAAAHSPEDAVEKARRALCGTEAGCLAQPPSSIQCRTR